jgi:hypothetical protein
VTTKEWGKERGDYERKEGGETVKEWGKEEAMQE